MTVQKQKEALRKTLIAKRFNFQSTPYELELLSLIEKYISITTDDLIAGYYPIQNEIDIRYIMSHFSHRNQIALPVTQKRKIIFREWKIEESETVLVPGMKEILEPNKYAPVVLPTIILVPCVGAAKNGHRLGYGMGCYDKAILKLRKDNHKFSAIGVVYDYQLTENVPFNEKDARLDWVITPERAIDCRSSTDRFVLV